MTTEKPIRLLLLLILVSIWLRFCGTNVGMSQDNSEMLQIQKETNCFRKGYMHVDFISQSSCSRKLLTLIVFVLYMSCCMFKTAFHNHSYFKWEYQYLRKCDILRFLHRRMTVFCLDDYIRDRLNNTPHHELMRYEWARYESFKTYPERAPHFPSSLARNGFYYTGDGTFVRCFCCGRRFDTTEHSDMAEAHRRCTPVCEFASGENGANVPIRQDALRNSTRTNGNNVQSSAMKYPAFASEMSRRQSYRHWPRRNEANGTQLAEAGFFYVGVGDSVHCFSCGIGIREWSWNHDPWKVHALHSPQCQHVRRCKGEEYVNRIHSALTHGTSGQEAQSLNRMARDIQSQAAQIVLSMGHSYARLMEAIGHFRRQHGDRELSAKTLVEYIHDTEQNILGPNTSNPVLFALAVAARNNTSNADRQERTSTNTVTEGGIQTNTRTGQLQEEVDMLKHKTVCKVCLDKEACIVFLPCGHFVACQECAQQLRKCAVCRATIKGTIRTYLS